MARQTTTLQLRPAATAEWTRLTLDCSLPDCLPQPVLYQLLSLLSFWSGQRLDVALAAADSGAWCERWADALADVPERHLRLRFDVKGEAEHDG